MENLIPNPSTPSQIPLLGDARNEPQSQTLFFLLFLHPPPLWKWKLGCEGLGIRLIQGNELLQNLLLPAALISEIKQSQLHTKRDKISIQIPMTKPLQPNPTFGIWYSTATLSKWFHRIISLSWVLIWPSFCLFVSGFLMDSGSFHRPGAQGNFLGSPLDKSWSAGN